VSVRLAEFVPRLDRLGCGSERAGHYLAVRQDDVLPSVDVVAMVLVQISLNVCFCLARGFADFKRPGPRPKFPLRFSRDKDQSGKIYSVLSCGRSFRFEDGSAC
jgi:hypothetical protein